MTPITIHDVAHALVQARQNHRGADSAAFAQALTEADQAYAVQDQVARTLGWFGQEPPRWWKSGGPSRQAELTHAPLPPQGVWTSPASARDTPFHQRGIEAEIALRLGQAVDAETARHLDLDSARALIDAMAVSIEIVDSRWSEGVHAPALLRLADLQSHGALTLGGWVHWQPEHDWSRQVCRTRIGSQAEVQRTGSHSCGDPAWVLPAWLRHATRDGHTLPAGTVVTTGTWVGLLQAQPGDRVEVDFDGIGSASVQL